MSIDRIARDRSRLAADAGRLLSSGASGSKVDAELAGLYEKSYRLAEDPAALAELERLLGSHAKRTAVAKPWLALVRLARTSSGADLTTDLSIFNSALPGASDRTSLVLQTEVARHLWRIENPGITWRRFAGKPLPDPSLGEAAVDAAILRLRLSAAAGASDAHRELAAQLDQAWIDKAGPIAPLVAVTIAEYEMTRGAYRAAIERLAGLGDSSDAGIQLAVLATRLHAMIECEVHEKDALGAEVKATVERLESVLAAGPTTNSLLPLSEGRVRQRRAEQLLALHCLRKTDEHGRQREDGKDEEAELQEVEAELTDPTVRVNKEAALRLQLEWVRLILELRGRSMAATCEDRASGVIADAHRLGLTVVEMLALDQRAILRARCFDERWAETMRDAGDAGRLAADLLALNSGSGIERSLRRTLLPILDRAVELLVEGAPLPAEAGHDVYGRAILDYVEQSMELALTEARLRFLAPAAPPSSGAALPKRTEDLQAALRPDEAVLQYFLVGPYLVVFAYGGTFFDWHHEQPEGVNARDALGIRTFLASLLPPWDEIHGQKRHVGSSDDIIEHPRVALDPEDLSRLAGHLLPKPIFAALDRRWIRRLTIVPHDVLYKTPFGLLPWGRKRLGERFALSIQPTGALAGRSSSTPWRPRTLPARVSFVKGPGLEHADSELSALRSALRSEVTDVDTVTHGADAFENEAPNAELLYLACHGSDPQESVDDAFLRLGDQLVGLRRIAGLDLQRCGLAVLQSCWTGWMDHLREEPVHGFPQGMLDAGAAAVVAPMFPVDDALCPIFTAVFGRALRFRPAGEALGWTLKVLRRHGEALASTDPIAANAVAWVGSFDAYEYRFTGDPAVSFASSWLNRQAARLAFHGWLLRRTWRTRSLLWKGKWPVQTQPTAESAGDSPAPPTGSSRSSSRRPAAGPPRAGAAPAAPSAPRGRRRP